MQSNGQTVTDAKIMCSILNKYVVIESIGAMLSQSITTNNSTYDTYLQKIIHVIILSQCTKAMLKKLSI